MDCNLSEELKVQHEGMNKFCSCQNKIESVQGELAVLNSEIRELEKALSKENKDVEDLKKGGLQAFYFKMRGKYDAKMDKEVLEAANAKMKLENKQFELEGVERRLRNLQEEREKYSGCEEKYIELYKRKMEELLSEENEAKISILRLQTKCSESVHNLKELEEAITAGERVFDELKEVEDSLSSASSLGTWDMLGGGILVDMQKHSHLDDAMESLNTAQSLMGEFRTELADVSMSLDIEINVGGFSKFADIFFDDFFSDWNMKNRIDEALSSVVDGKEKVEEVIEELKQRATEESSNLDDYENQIEIIVNNA